MCSTRRKNAQRAFFLRVMQYIPNIFTQDEVTDAVYVLFLISTVVITV